MAHRRIRMRGRAAGAVMLAAMLVLALPVTGLAAKDKGPPTFSYSISEEGVTIEKYLDTGKSSVTVPATIDGRDVIRIGAYAFAEDQMDEESGYTYIVPRTDIESINLPYGLLEIERGAFQGLERLQCADVPDSVTKLGFGVFRDCTELSQARLSENLDEIPDHAFKSCGLSSITIPEGVRRIGESAFAEDRDLMEVQLPESLLEIGDGAFSSCTSLEHLVIPDGVSSMGVGALGGSALRECTIPASVTEVSAGLFMWCDSLQTVRFRAVPEQIVQNAFLDCPNLQTVEVNATADEWQALSVDGTGNTSLLKARTVCLLEPEAGSVSPSVLQDSHMSFMDSIMLRRDSSMRLLEDGGQWQLRGIVAGRADSALRPDEVLNVFELPEDVKAFVVSTSTSERIVTGDRIRFEKNGEILSEITVIVEGDVIGSGVISLSQLVRMTSAVSGRDPLAGAYLVAGDFTGSGAIDLSDIVREASLLRAARS